MAEKKYIEHEAAIFAIQKKMKEYIDKSMQPIGFGKYREDSVFTNAALGCRAAIEEVKSIPAADVRPVVLCKDCMLRQYCKVAQYLGADGFCSNGEKREES